MRVTVSTATLYLARGSCVVGEPVIVNVECAQNRLYYQSEHVLGVSKTPRTITWSYTALEKRPGTVMQTRRQRNHQSNTLSRRPRSTQHPKRIFFRIPSHVSQQERIKAAQDHGVAPQGWRAIASEAQVAAPLTQHTNDQSAGSSPMGGTLACGAAPRAIRKSCL